MGKDGRVADHGFLWEMLTKAREMAVAADGGEAPASSVERKADFPVPGGEPPAAPATPAH